MNTKTMIISSQVYHRIIQHHYGYREAGGLLGSTRGPNYIDTVVFDKGKTTPDRFHYIPDSEKLNLTLQKWEDCGILFCGIFHSHLLGDTKLSEQDKNYINTIMNSMPADISQLQFPLFVLPQKEFVCFCARKENNKILIDSELLTIE